MFKDKSKRYQEEALALITNERKRQDGLWGTSQYKDFFEFITCLGEEYGELCEALNETCFPNKVKRPEKGGHHNILKEATHVAAVCVKIMEGLLDPNSNFNKKEADSDE